MITEVEVAGITLDIEYEFTKGDDRENDYPGSPDKVEIHDLTLNGVNVWDLIDPLHIERIEEDIIHQHRSF